jgi:NADPH:quinone reductase-like Zn-dependent oxidoreductase
VTGSKKEFMPSMKAIRIHEYGDANVLVYEEAPRPVPADDGILVRIQAAGVNPIDWKIRAGLLKAWLPQSLPFTLGADFSGIVEEVGPKASAYNVGDAVFGEADITGPHGSYAEFTCVRAKHIALKPRKASHIEAAALPVVATTAWQALFGDDGIDLRPGQTILIHGGAGGVGSTAIQLAKWRGARVIATASSANQDFLRELDVDEPVDYTKAPFEKVVGQVDAVLDTLGGETQERSWAVVKRGGTLASVRGEPSQDQAATYGVRGLAIHGERGLSALGRIAELVDLGALKPQVTKILPLSEARRAHELSETGHVRGKIVLQVS